MSLYGMMRTGVSGMNAQANRLSAVSDNIANSSTTGYKGSSTEFSSLLTPSTNGTYNSGGVQTSVRNSISTQGSLTYTTSDTDLAINGDGFFLVQDAAGQTYMTRAGAFTPDENGNLVNAAGYKLMGYSYGDTEPAATANGYAGLEVVNINGTGLSAAVSTTGTFSANLNSGATAVDATVKTLPSAATTTTAVDDVGYTSKSSLTAYDSLGNEVVYDLYFTKTSDNEWEVAAYNKADADATSGSFPYSSAMLATQTLTFDSTTGQLDSTSATTLTVPGGTIDNMTDDFVLDLSDMTQLATKFTVSDAEANGHGASAVSGVSIDGDGTVYAKYSNGDTSAIYKIALATVTSPDNMEVVSGNVYTPTTSSGEVEIGFAESGAFGSVVSGALEESNVDLANELTTMIASQRSYTANSKVFQTASDLLDTLVNLKR